MRPCGPCLPAPKSLRSAIGTSRAAVSEADAGTTISIAPGTYPGGPARSRLRGTKAQPIVLAGADPANPPGSPAARAACTSRPPSSRTARPGVCRSELQRNQPQRLGIGGFARARYRAPERRGARCRPCRQPRRNEALRRTRFPHRRLPRAKLGEQRVGHRPGRVPARDHRRLHVCRRGRRLRQRRGNERGKPRHRYPPLPLLQRRWPGGQCRRQYGTGVLSPRPEGFEAKDITVRTASSSAACPPLPLWASTAPWCSTTPFTVRAAGGADLARKRRPAVRRLPQRPLLKQRRSISSDECREVVNVGGQTAPRRLRLRGTSGIASTGRPPQRLVRLPVPETEGTYDAAPRSKLPSAAICNFAKESRTTPACEPKQFRRKSL